MPLANVGGLNLACILEYCERCVAEAEADSRRHASEALTLTAEAEAARRLAAEAEEERARVVAAAEEATLPIANAAMKMRLAAAAEASLQEHASRAVAEPGAPAAVGGVGGIFADWEHAFVAQIDKRALLQLIAVRARRPCATPLLRPAPLVCSQQGIFRLQAADYIKADRLLDLACASVANAAKGAGFAAEGAGFAAPRMCFARSGHAAKRFNCTVPSPTPGRQDGGRSHCRVHRRTACIQEASEAARGERGG